MDQGGGKAARGVQGPIIFMALVTVQDNLLLQ
jgi:hypothetical protein